MLTRSPISDNHKKADPHTVLHRIACVFCGLITVYYLFMCYCSFHGALDDMRKFGGLGFSYSLGHYLVKNSFPEAIGMALPVTTEFALYVILYRRAAQKKSYLGSVLYFSMMLVFHIAIWLHASSLDFPEFPPYITAEGVGMGYYIFASITLFKSIIYSILYLLRVRKFRSEMDA